MKIAVVIDTWFPAIGGGQINAYEISKLLAKKGVDVTILTRNNGKVSLPNIAKLKITRLGEPSEPLNNISRLIFLINSFFIIKKNNFDIVHLHAFLPGLLAPFIKTFLKKPVIFTVHGTRMFEKKPKMTFGLWLEKIILTKINYDLQISVTKAFLNFNNVNKNQAQIPNGVDSSRFQRVKVKKASYPKILWVGRFDPIKRVEDLIQAMKLVHKKIPEARLSLVGYGQDESKLKELVRKLGIDCVDFVGKKEGDSLIREYKSSHLFVLPSSSEGQPLSILEAKSAELPIVATNVGGIPEILDESGGDKLVKPTGIDSLANAIITTIKSNKKEKAKRIEIQTWDYVAAKTLSVYKSTIHIK